MERYKYFRQYGKDALLLTVLAYNVGHGRLLGYGKHPDSNLINKIESGDRDIYKKYISHHLYKGKPIPGIELVNGRDCAFGTYRTIATKASLSPASNAAEKESFNCCIYISRYFN